MFVQDTLDTYARKLSSNNPTPGGGSSTAYLGLLACSLALKQYALSTEKQQVIMKYRALQLETLREDFASCMDTDAYGFQKLMDAFKLPKTTEEEIATRKDAIRQGYRHCIETPIKIIKLSCEAFYCIKTILHYGNPNLSSDSLVGLCYLQASINASSILVQESLPKLSKQEIEDYTRLLQEGQLIIKLMQDFINNHRV